MKATALLVLLVALTSGTEGRPQGFWDKVTAPFRFVKEAAQGAHDMYNAYSDMREANYVNSDKYFHARGNYDAASRGPGGEWAARVISNGREAVDQWRGNHDSIPGGHGVESSRADQEANEWGRGGGDPNIYRPAGLPSQY